MRLSSNLLVSISSSNLGGAQVYVHALCVLLRSYNYNVIVIVGDKGWLSQKLDQIGIDCYLIPSLASALPHSAFKTLRSIHKLNKKYKFKLVISNSSIAGLQCRISCRILRLNSLFVVHGFSFMAGIFWLKKCKLFIEYLVELLTASHYLLISEYDLLLAQQYLSISPHRRHLIPNSPLISASSFLSCSDLSIKPSIINFLAPLKKCSSISDPLIKICCVARLAPQKNHLLLFRSVKQLVSVGYDVRLVCIGNGPTKQSLHKFIIINNLCKHIFLVDHLDNPSSFFQYFDAFVLPSFYEGLPLALLEALASNMPVIASPVGGIPALLLNFHEILPTSEKEWVDAIAMLHHQPRFCQLVVSAIRARFELRNNIHENQARLLALISSIIL